MPSIPFLWKQKVRIKSIKQSKHSDLVLSTVKSFFFALSLLNPSKVFVSRYVDSLLFACVYEISRLIRVCVCVLLCILEVKRRKLCPDSIVECNLFCCILNWKFEDKTNEFEKCHRIHTLTDGRKNRNQRKRQNVPSIIIKNYEIRPSIQNVERPFSSYIRKAYCEYWNRWLAFTLATIVQFGRITANECVRFATNEPWYA